MFVIIVSGLYAVIYAAPRLEGIGIKTDIIKYEQLPIADTVTGIFVRDEILYTAAYSGSPQYMVEAGTKIRAGTQVVYIAAASGPESSGAGANEAPLAQAASMVEADKGDASETETGTAKSETAVTFESISMTAGYDMVASEGGISPWTAIVSYRGDGWERKVTPENIMSLPKSIFDDAPGEAVDLTRSYVNAGEPIYRITNNNLWHVAFWIENVDKVVFDKYRPGQILTVNLGTTKVKATVEAAEPRGKDLFVLLKSDMYYKDLDKYRKYDMDVVFSEVSGAVINKEALKIKSGKVGVYVKQQSGTFKWIPVKALEESGGRFLIAENSFIDDEGKRVETIRYYDEIMSNPSEEGY